MLAFKNTFSLKILLPLCLLTVSHCVFGETKVYNFPLDPEQELASWMPVLPLDWQESDIRRIEVPVAGLPAGSSLLVSAIFLEVPGMIGKVLWEPAGQGAPVELIRSLTEGIDGWNQKTFLLPDEFGTEGGTIVFETSGNERIIQRLSFSLLERGDALVAPERANDMLVENGDKIVRSADLGADYSLATPDAWFGNMIEAYLQEGVEPVGEGIEFSVEIRPAPSRAIVRFDFNGSSTAPALLVNGTPVQGVSMEVPSLQSAGYIADGSEDGFFYAGWRKGWAIIPAQLLRAGDNSFTFFGAQSQDYIRGTMLEMWFPSPLLAPEQQWEDITEDLAGPLPVAEKSSAADLQKIEDQPPVSAANLFRTSIR